MRIIENKHRHLTERTIYCAHCTSKLAITDADIMPMQGEHVALCPCCQRHFPCMTEAELTAAHYAK